MTKKVRRKKERKKHGDTSRERHDEEKKKGYTETRKRMVLQNNSLCDLQLKHTIILLSVVLLGILLLFRLMLFIFYGSRERITFVDTRYYILCVSDRA